MSITNVKGFLLSLRTDLQRLNTLTHTLEHQYELLSMRRSNELEDLNHQMVLLLGQLKISNDARDNFMLSLGLSGDKAGMEKLRDRLPSPLKEATTKLLQELSLKSSMCCMMNEKSGKLLAHQKQLISRLTGQPDQRKYPEQTY